MQSLRDATVLLILILLAFSVRVTPADPQADAPKGVQAAVNEASLLPAVKSAFPAVDMDLAEEHLLGDKHFECKSLNEADLPDDASGVVLILEIERDGTVERKVLVTDTSSKNGAGLRNC